MILKKKIAETGLFLRNCYFYFFPFNFKMMGKEDKFRYKTCRMKYFLNEKIYSGIKKDQNIRVSPTSHQHELSVPLAACFLVLTNV